MKNLFISVYVFLILFSSSIYAMEGDFDKSLKPKSDQTNIESESVVSSSELKKNGKTRQVYKRQRTEKGVSLTAAILSAEFHQNYNKPLVGTT